MAINQLKIGAIISYIALFVNVTVGLVYTPWMISSIGQDNYGLYTLALSVISLFVFDFGISQAVTRFVAKYLAENNQEKANNCMGLVYKLYLYIDFILLVIVSVFYFFIPIIYNELSDDEIGKFKIIYIATAFFSVVSFPFVPLNGLLTAAEKFVQLKICDLIHKVLIVLLMSLCLLSGFGLFALVLVNIIAGLIVILIKLYFIKKDTSIRVNITYKNKEEFKELLGFSGWVTIKSLSERLMFTISPTILAMVSGSVEIAFFGIVNTIEGYVFSFAGALNGFFLPSVSRITAQEGSILPLMIRVGRLLLLVVGLIVLGFLAVGNDFINLWLGNGYEVTYVSSVLVILPSLFYIPHEIGVCAITVQNKVKHHAFVFLGMGLMNIVLGYFMARICGCLGICVAIFFSSILKVIGTDVILYKYLSIDVLSFYKNVIVRIGVPLVFVYSLSLLFQYFCIDGLIGFFMKGFFVVITYLFVMYIFVLDDTEKSLFAGIFSKISFLKKS